MGELWCGVKSIIVMFGFVVDFVFIVYFMYDSVFVVGKIDGDSVIE